MQGLQKKFLSKTKKKPLLVAEGLSGLSAKGLFAESQSGQRSAKVAGLGPALGHVTFAECLPRRSEKASSLPRA
jgi:hypothetical protein